MLMSNLKQKEENTDQYGWIQTYTGQEFWGLYPRKGDIRIEDIAHSLALTCRWNGHCKVFYSVAQHSCNVETHAGNKLKNSRKKAILHDAHEPLLFGDISSPYKSALPSWVKSAENNLDLEIETVFNIPINDEIRKIVKQADLDMLFFERDEIMSINPIPYDIEHLHPGGTIHDIDPNFYPWTWQEAEQKFLERYEELWNKK